MNKNACSITGNIDNVNDPVYNMKNIIKQTILLEEHLAEDRKYCQQCCVKHFNHIIGLAEEAIWMSDNKKYPLMNESAQLYNKWFEIWVKNRENATLRKDILINMRKLRQALIKTYYLN